MIMILVNVVYGVMVGIFAVSVMIFLMLVIIAVALAIKDYIKRRW